ncbi:GNAT family N-acetyltransferase [Psychrobacter sp. APC 3426]|uniref:GNAT family N-acetyltransferase n=1 Tax=Psychrobacter sp. APC 3426 TaxID=3035177 RepID=UPI0025B3381B|nr:GNAT family N-acetyltransferase [Psychrobacter sp. APC 3426]MDN3399412.1 GNAT family N-acetyltransferase [Psychrobacter sp. APC 3426]
MEYCIRVAQVKDHEFLLLLMKDHAHFEGHELVLSKQHQQLGSLESLPLTIFVVESNNKLMGYMSVIKQFSTWDMDWYLYLDCLYLNEETRGQGIGMELMQKIKLFSQENNINTIQWQTPKDNLSAIKFYQKLGAINKEKYRFFWSV